MTGESERDVKQGSGNGHLSTQEPQWGTCKGARFTKNIQRQKNSSGNEASLSMTALLGILGGRAPLLGTLKDL